jgi:hypothetical protein
MTVDTIKTTQPTVLVEFTFTEVKILRDVLGEIIPNEVEAQIRKSGLDVHPNLKEYIRNLYNSFYDAAEKMVEAATPSIRKHI